MIFWAALAVAEESRPDPEDHRDRATAPVVAGFDRFARHGDIDGIQGGRLLLSELSCTACHSSGGAAAGKNAPDAKSSDKSPPDQQIAPKGGPRLHSAGRRYSQAWLAEFIASPHRVKPGTTMPDLLGSRPLQQRQEISRAIAAFLTHTQRAEYPAIKASGSTPVRFEFWNHGDANRGSEIFHSRGCVACHSSGADRPVSETSSSPVDALLDELDPEELEEMGLAGAARRVDSIPLGRLEAKYARKSLTHFLHDPALTRPALRMPDFQLSTSDAADLAEYLLTTYSLDGPGSGTSRSGASRSGTPSGGSANDAALVAKGRQWFNELNCSSCHDTSSETAKVEALPLSAVDASAGHGCLSDSPHRSVHYSLDRVQRDAIGDAIGGIQSGRTFTATEQLDGILLATNCYGCHQREDMGGVGRYRKSFFETEGHVDLGDEGRLPPPLTGVGRKLTSAHLTNVLSGKAAAVRPYMQIQMPRFSPDVTRSVPTLFAEVDQAHSVSEKQVFGDAAGLAEAGRELMDIGCVQCHAFAGNSLPGVVGIDLSKIGSRIQPAWFEEFLLDPGAVKARTRMPTFFIDGKSPRPDLLGGDPKRQIVAMWMYLKALPKHSLPRKIERSRAESYELDPQGQPLVLRTFMKAAGTHAIAVGFAEDVHFSYDAEQVRLATAWRGKFLDARGTWFVRSAPPAEPLGKDVVDFPSGFSFAKLSGKNEPWPLQSAVRFGGYRLGDGQTPEFFYRYGGFEVSDQIRPAGSNRAIDPEAKPGLQRRLTIAPSQAREKAQAEVVWFRALSGRGLQRVDDHTMRNEAGVMVSLPPSLASDAYVYEGDGMVEWRVPAREFPFQIEVDYSW
ncbi:c-type cytochrome [Allorhodopirellula solitaria]|uniref:c-type cytochrome n=1 Tax=Allorhodopirellula solitaria TaxID=2527987 RepID=UPI001647227F|nr:c-type cytochrome [Allorhodopirellula solitaria]